MIEENSTGQIEKQILSCSIKLTEGFKSLFRHLEKNPERPVDLCKLLGINKDLASKIMQALSQQDPFAAVHMLPGPESLRTLSRAAARKIPDKSCVKQFKAAVEEYDGLLRNTLGGRSALNAVISAMLPEARLKFETANKQLLFKAVSNLKGFMADVFLESLFILPNTENASRLDIGCLLGYVGLRRLLPGVPIPISVGTIYPDKEATEHQTFDGKSVNSRNMNVLLTEFCSKPLPEISIREQGTVIQYLLTGDSFGLNSGVDVFIGEIIRGYIRRYRNPDENRLRGFGSGLEIPARWSVLDILLHDSVWPDTEPKFAVYDTGIYGGVDPNDLSRDIHKLDLMETVQFLGKGINRFRIGEISSYTDMLQYACSSQGWEPDEFRCYRCHVQYPFYPGQMTMMFEPGLNPE